MRIRAEKANVPLCRIGLFPLWPQDGGDEFLAGATFKDRLRVAGLLGSRAGRSLLHGLGAPLWAAIGFARPLPERLLIAPQDIRTS
ncbi:MAG: hypothetical protein FWD08_06945, partial [Alphaproteobacteria bacterium]|nr:hypothetical protein [Alphaproteobacteria bacterium]